MAHAQPRALFGVTGAALLASVWWAMAQSPSGTSSSSGAAASHKPFALTDLPQMMEGYGQRRAKVAAQASSASTKAIGTRRFALTEVDLTPGNVSDEREPSYSPNGDFIVFASNGIDTRSTALPLGDGRIDALNANRKYHIWIMNRNGSNQRQITGLSAADVNRDQRRPSFSPDGNQVVYTDTPVPAQGDNAAVQLFVAQPFEDSSTTTVGVQPPTEQRTFSRGVKSAPAWSPSGQEIAFAANADLTNAQAPSLGQFEIFTIEPSGNQSSITRLTGTTSDPVGRGTNDLNPAYAVTNPDVIFFSSNRTLTSGGGTKVLAAGRRIWVTTSRGTVPRQVTDPLQRPNPRVADEDDFPSVSIGAADQLSFQTNSLIDSSDTTPDINVWSLSVNSTQFRPPATPTPAPTPLVAVSGFSSNNVVQFDARSRVMRGAAIGGGTTSRIIRPEGVAYTPDNQLLLIASRGTNTIQAVDVRSGAFAAAPFVPASAVNAGGVPLPTFIKFGPDGNIYVASGNDEPTQQSSDAVHRYTPGGDPLPSVGAPDGSSIFTFGETVDADGVDARVGVNPTGSTANAGGFEGFDFGPDGRLYVSAVFDNKINVYNSDGQSEGVYVVGGSFGTPGPGGPNGLRFPTGLAFGPDADGDGTSDLYVNSSATDEVKIYSGPSGNFSRRGRFIRNAVQDTNGTAVGVNSPEGLAFADLNQDGRPELYVSSFKAVGDTSLSASGTGNRVSRFDTFVAGGSTAPNALVPGDTSPIYVTSPSLRGAGYFAFNPSAQALGVVPTPTPVPLPIALEASSPATLETNRTSSPAAKPGFTGAIEDVVADREPAYARAGNGAITNSVTAQLAFASQRKAAAAPSSNATNPAPVEVNPGGGPTGTHDIWSTATQDFTPPILIPQGVGQQVFPLLAPGPQAPVRPDPARPELISAPRTPPQGLRAGGPVTVALVLSERESGLASVTASFFDANQPSFLGVTDTRATQTSLVNEKLPVQIAPEGKAAPAVGADGSLMVGLPLTAYDDGPRSSGGNELQAGAIKGDGIFYCVGTFTTPPNASDFYIDIRVEDNSPIITIDPQTGQRTPHNKFVYDNIWGFATADFRHVGNNDLFVSDYTAGQEFPDLLSLNNQFNFGDQGFRFFDQIPVESYYLSNPLGVVLDDNGQPAPGRLSDSVDETFPNVDVWRIQCRGEIPPDVYTTYQPGETRQIDPKDVAGNFRAVTRRLADARTAILWGSPYTTTVFTGPGTLADAETQRRLTNFQGAGGRLFVSGRDVAFGLSVNGTTSNGFLNNELGTTFTAGQELNVDSLNADDAGKFTSYENAQYVAGRGLPAPAFVDGNFNDPQLPSRLPPLSMTDQENTYEDAAIRFKFNSNIATGEIGIDVINPVANAGTLTTAYTSGGNVVGQRIQKTRASGVESRAVFFSFGFEGVNRRYAQRTVGQTPVRAALNVRRNIADAIRTYFKTGGISGTVINDTTNQPVADFLVQIEGPGGPYLARTDSNGFYQVQGLPSGGYRVGQAQEGSFPNQNPGFFPRPLLGTFTVSGPNSVSASFRVIPIPPGSLNGIAIDPSGNPIPNLPILIRTANENSNFTNAGPFVQIVRTDAGGRFNFTNVPASIAGQSAPLEVIFNPAIADVPVESNLQLNYRRSGGPSAAFASRTIPDDRRPGIILARPGDTFFLNDLEGDTAANDTTITTGTTTTTADRRLVVPFKKRAISGRVVLSAAGTTKFINGAIVELIQAGKVIQTVRSATINTADGRYGFRNIIAGNYQIRASLTFGNRQTTTTTINVTVAPDADLVAPDIILVASSLNGTVSFRGTPINGATVELFLQVPLGTALPSKPLISTTTRTIGGKVGQYVIAPLPPGAYTGRASVGGGVAVVPFSVGAADKTVNFNLTRQDVSGTVRVNNIATAGVTVQLFKDGVAVPGQTMKTVSGGRFAFFGVAVGTGYTVQASFSAPKGIGTDTASSAPFNLIVNQNLPGVTVELLLQSVSGRVTLNGAALAGIKVNLTTGTGSTTISTTTDSSGNFTFSGVAAGSYTLDATSPNGDTVTPKPVLVVERRTSLINQNIALLEETVVGQVTLNGTGFVGASVVLSGGSISRTVRTVANGAFRFAGLPAGTYTITATGMGRTGTATVTVPRNGGTITVPPIALIDTRAPQFAQGRTFMISIPFADNNTIGGTVSVARAFTSLATENGQTNFRLYSVDPTKVGDARYVLLNNNSLLERGKGYFLETLLTGASLTEARDDPRLKPLDSGVREFTVTLRLNPSSNDTSTGFNANGYNLIGFPFDQTVASSIDWGSARVILPDGTVYDSVDEAAANGKMSSILYTLQTGSDNVYTATKTLTPRTGYYARTLVDGLKVVLRVPDPTGPIP